MAWSNHEISGDYMSAILVWLEGSGSGDLQELAQVGVVHADVAHLAACAAHTLLHGILSGAGSCGSWRRCVMLDCPCHASSTHRPSRPVCCLCPPLSTPAT